MSMISAKQMRAMAHELRRDTGTEYSDVDLRMYDASEMLRTLAAEREQASQAVGVVAKLRELYEAIPVGPCSHVALAVKGILDAEPARSVQAKAVGVDVERWARFIVNNQPAYYKDWACSECAPESEILRAGFVCVIHQAKASMQSANGGEVES